MDTYEVELEPAAPDGFAATVPAVPGLLVLGRDINEVLERVRAAITFHVGGPLSVHLVVERGELPRETYGFRDRKSDAHTRELVGDRSGFP
jgi:predicted RNase H-like HicB family nuclease